MRRRDFIKLGLATGAVMMFTHPVFAAPQRAPQEPRTKKQRKKITTADRLAVANRTKAAGLTQPAIGTAQMTPGAVPHYFSHPNYANSPLRLADVLVELQDGGGTGATATATVDLATGAITAIDVLTPGSGYTSAPTVSITSPIAGGTGASATATVDYSGVVSAISVLTGGSAYSAPLVTISGGGATTAATARATGGVDAIAVTNGGSGYTQPVVTFSLPQDPNGVAATGSASFDANGVITGIAVVSPGSGYTSAPTVAITDGIAPDLGPGSGATATATLSVTGFILDSFGSGYTSVPTVTIADSAGTGSGATATASITTSGGAVTGVTVDNGGSGYATRGIKKFVDTLPGLGAGAANNLGQYIPVAVPDTTTYPGSDYYVIELGEYTEKMHSDLPPTKLRGYRQAGGEFHYLGPAIVATKDRPVRILFRNLLPTGAGGNLFIPVDTTVMGSGLTADGHMDPEIMMADPQKPPASEPGKEALVARGLAYAENRATLHLHGGISPWISDGTPHQWTTPANETTAYPKGVSVVPVPDMNNPAPGPGEMTFYYTNQQSARLLFYHDHAWGITRLNVYAGEAAPYIITDDTEKKLVADGTIPGDADTIPLVIQDKTFVPSEAQLAVSDNTWDIARWGGEGNLWVPHVYSPAQNPGDASGVNQYGRWAYGPWFWPPTNNIEHGPIDNPYYDPTCDPDLGWCEPPLMPGVPYLSMGMESFNDTAVVNGTVYPTTTVDPKAYRLRILNAANDRFLNLSLYKADASGTEVALNPAEVEAALTDPAGVFPTPVAGAEGPSWIQIGTEGGFLPAPVVIPAHPTTWVTDPTVFNAGNVDQHSLLLAPAERADVIVDFSRFAGQTLILYNDAPAAFPARDPRYDYYTGNADLRDAGGAPSTAPGYGPNTRTVMQIKVADTAPAPAFNLAALQTAFKATSLGGQGVFQNGQHPIIVGQGAYNSAYGTAFTGNEGLAQIYSTSLTFKTVLGASLSVPLKPKMIQDEMGEAFELQYGRMSGFLGVESPNAQAGLQNMILHPYTYPPDEIIDGLELPAGVKLEPIAAADDGTQIWKFTHNGVDTHPIHFHLYDVQLLNRVGWDGIIRKPDANELGWKDTIRISPLEDTIVALRPLIPQLPFDLPNSIRLLDPSMHEGMYLEGANTTQREAAGLPLLAFNPDGEPVDIVNHYVNFGWEYVYHCHILSHEEMDMMHSQVVGVAPAAPTFVSAVRSGSGNQRVYTVTWIDNSKNETAFVIERRVAGSTGAWAVRAIVPSSKLDVVPYVETGVGPGTGTRTYVDRIGNTNTLYEYQVYAINVVGDTWDYSNPAFNEIPPGGGWPTLTLDSRGGVINQVAAPSGLTASAVIKNSKTARVTLSWTDNSGNETGFLIQRADNAGFSLGVVNATVGANVNTFGQDVARKKTFYYRVLAFNDTIQSGWSNTASVTTP